MHRRAASTTLAACGGDSGADASGGGGDKAPLEVWVRKPPGSPTEKTRQDLAGPATPW